MSFNERVAAWTEAELGVEGKVLDVVRAPAQVLSVPGKDVDPYDGREWRTGADEATTLKTDKALKFGSLSVPAGTYTVYTIPTGGTWHLVISKKTGQWGIPYPKGEDLGRAPMTVGKAPAAAEQLTISVQDTQTGGTLHIDWGATRASIPFTIG